MFDLEPIKARLAAVTPGPWEARQDSRFPTIKTASGESIAMFNLDATMNDAAFIAAAPADVAALVAEVERLRAVVDVSVAVYQARERHSATSEDEMNLRESEWDAAVEAFIKAER